MEPSEDQSLPEPQIDDQKLNQQLDLGFQSSHSLTHNPDPETLEIKQIVAEQLQALVLKEDENEEAEAGDEEGRELKKAIDEELCYLALKEAVNEAIQGKSSSLPVHEDEELKYQALRRFAEEALDLHGLKKSEEEKVSEEVRVFEIEKGVLGHEEKDLGQEDDGVGKHEIEGWNGSFEVKENYYDGWGTENGDGEDGNEVGVVYDNEEEGENGSGIDGCGATGAAKDDKVRKYHYPLRSDAEDCSYYIRTGMCKFGSNCKFNHPLRRKNQATKETIKQKDDNSDSPGQIECKYYLSSGGCKYGKACKYSHSRGRAAVAPIVEFNFLGLPIRPGEKECPYYMRNGSCKYGSNCRFNHPDPTAVGGVNPPTGHGNNGSAPLQGSSPTTLSSWSSPRTFNETAPFVPMMYPPTQGIPSPNPEWSGYQDPVYPPSERSLPTPPAFVINNPPNDTNLYTHQQRQLLIGDFPERPGQPECSYFMKTGDCKYRSACKFHHPKSRIPKTSPSVLSNKGLPLRPDQNICMHYSRYGICKYGPACKYDHPVNYSNSVSVGGSGPDGPRTVGGGTGRESLIQQPV